MSIDLKEEHPPQVNDETLPADRPSTDTPPRDKSFGQMMGDWLRIGNSETARDALEDLIEEAQTGEGSLGINERQLLANILDLQGQTIADVMVPRVDVIAAKTSITYDGLADLVSKEGHSRMPLYVDTLDDAFAIVHVKDMVTWRGEKDDFDVSQIARTVLFVSPSMHVLELLLEMRAKRIHMAFVVDEYGGVDGLVTIEDLVEEIVGEIEDEFDTDEKPAFEQSSDGSWIAGARTPLKDMAVVLGNDHFNGDDYEDIETLGGLVVSLAGHVPIRGELLVHETGLEFEILDADPRRVKRVRVRILAVQDVNPAEL